MTLNELITTLKEKLLQNNALEVLCYHFIKKNTATITKFDTTSMSGEVERIAVESFSSEFSDLDGLQKAYNRIKKKSYRGLTIYHYIGLFIQNKIADIDLFTQFIKEYFDNHSFRFRYLLAKVFSEFEEPLRIKLSAELETKDSFVLILKHIYLESELNKGIVLPTIISGFEDLDIIDLLLLEDLENTNSIQYSKTQEKLFKDILWCASEIQSKHRVLNNNEDQYNSNFQSLLRAKEYKTEPQTQRGQSYVAQQYGELDIAIFTKDDFPLSIFEALVIDSINKDYITSHIKKLSENYDPNGLKNNYIVIYAKSKNFNDLWERYKNFIPTIEFEHKITANQFTDISGSYPQLAGIRTGKTEHQNRGFKVQIYHIFMDMNF